MTIPSGRPPRIVVTGAAGFIGWHARVRLHALGEFEVIPINHNDFASEALLNAVTDADVVTHLAGINRNGINFRSVEVGARI